MTERVCRIGATGLATIGGALTYYAMAVAILVIMLLVVPNGEGYLHALTAWWNAHFPWWVQHVAMLIAAYTFGLQHYRHSLYRHCRTFWRRREGDDAEGE